MHFKKKYYIIILACDERKYRQVNMAPWSSGQDASLSRWNQGFDSPRSHLRSAEYSADLFVSAETIFLYKKRRESTYILCKT